MPSAFAKPAEKVNVNMSYALLPLNWCRRSAAAAGKGPWCRSMRTVKDCRGSLIVDAAVCLPVFLIAMGLPVFTHVKPDKLNTQLFSQASCNLCFSDTCRTDEQKACQGLIFFDKSGT